ncbi:hypothetical protein DM02DRAFT_717840 [Periconia macrospinosa]|uniref:TMEM205-like domain-containing protein n=1 Tax=Periconia macrospinosa TaxID=97972 RepID=A0A2V1DWB8_9PLEO|nr:hypothetical protein DM02DRAFT_717840 [Periconia macrospinosa]
MLQLPVSALQSLLPPVHLLAYSTLLGTQVFESFVVVRVAHQALPYESFTTLQKQLFPTYFRCQSALLFITAVTLPRYGPLSLFRAGWKILTPFIVAGAVATLNAVYYGPMTSRLMMTKRFQAEMEARRDDGSISEELEKLNRSFKRAHAMSIHLNAITIVATLWYGWTLASHIKF